MNLKQLGKYYTKYVAAYQKLQTKVYEKYGHDISKSMMTANQFANKYAVRKKYKIAAYAKSHTPIWTQFAQEASDVILNKSQSDALTKTFIEINGKQDFNLTTQKLLNDAGIYAKYANLPSLKGLEFKVRAAEMLQELDDLGYGDSVSSDVFGS